MQTQHVPRKLFKLASRAPPETSERALQLYYESRGIDSAAAATAPKLRPAADLRQAMLSVLKHGVLAIVSGNETYTAMATASSDSTSGSTPAQKNTSALVE